MMNSAELIIFSTWKVSTNLYLDKFTAMTLIYRFQQMILTPLNPIQYGLNEHYIYTAFTWHRPVIFSSIFLPK